MRAESLARLIAASILTLVYALWIALIANQQPYFILLGVFFLGLAAAWVTWGRLWQKRSMLVDCAAGVVAGYAAMVVTSLGWRCFISRAGCSGLNASSDLAFFPVVSLGWLYAGALFVLLREGMQRRSLVHACIEGGGSRQAQHTAGEP